MNPIPGKRWVVFLVTLLVTPNGFNEFAFFSVAVTKEVSQLKSPVLSINWFSTRDLKSTVPFRIHHSVFTRKCPLTYPTFYPCGMFHLLCGCHIATPNCTNTKYLSVIPVSPVLLSCYVFINKKYKKEKVQRPSQRRCKGCVNRKFKGLRIQFKHLKERTALISR